MNEEIRKNIRLEDIIPNDLIKYTGLNFSRDWVSYSIYKKNYTEILITYDKLFDDFYIKTWENDNIFIIKKFSDNIIGNKQKIRDFLEKL